MSIVFAKTRQFYQPYQDVYRLVELAGFQLQFIDEVDWERTDVVIATPKHPEWTCIPQRKKATLIWWSFERMLHVDALDMASPVVPDVVDEVWVSDRALAERYNFRYVFLGGHEGFAQVDARVKKEFDLITLMYWSGRRQALQPFLAPFSMADRPSGCWGEERARRINASRLMLSAHQDEQPWSEPIKFALAGMYGIPLLSEVCADSGYWRAGEHYMATTFHDLSTAARILLNHPVSMRIAAANAWRLVCRERPFRETVENAALSIRKAVLHDA